MTDVARGRIVPASATNVRIAHSAKTIPIAAASQPEHDGFEHELPCEIPARGAERRSQRELAPARQAGSQQQIRDIGAGDQQHEDDRAHEQSERLHDIAHDGLKVRLDVDAVVVAELRGQRPAERDHLALRLCHRDARLQPRVGRQKMIAAIRRIERALHRHEQIAAAMLELARQHANHLIGLVVDRHLPAEHARIGRESTPPIGIRQHDNLRTSRLVLRFAEPSPQRRRKIEDRHEARGGADNRHALRLARIGHDRQLRARSANRREHRIARLPVDVFLPRRRTGRASRLGVVHEDEPVRVGIRQRLQQHAVEQTEYRGRDPDPQRERDDRKRRDHPAAHERPPGDANVVQYSAHDSELDEAAARAVGRGLPSDRGNASSITRRSIRGVPMPSMATTSNRQRLSSRCARER